MVHIAFQRRVPFNHFDLCNTHPPRTPPQQPTTFSTPRRPRKLVYLYRRYHLKLAAGATFLAVARLKSNSPNAPTATKSLTVLAARITTPSIIPCFAISMSRSWLSNCARHSSTRWYCFFPKVRKSRSSSGWTSPSTRVVQTLGKPKSRIMARRRQTWI